MQIKHYPHGNGFLGDAHRKPGLLEDAERTTRNRPSPLPLPSSDERVIYDGSSWKRRLMDLVDKHATYDPQNRELAPRLIVFVLLVTFHYTFLANDTSNEPLARCVAESS